MTTDPQLKPIIDALLAYREDQQTLTAVVDAAVAAFGPDWINFLLTALDNATDIDPAQAATIKEKANHAIHYFGALSAWDEAHQYLNAEEPVDTMTLIDRIPTLEYWLTLFGDEGTRVVNQLKDLLQKLTPPADVPTETQEAPVVSAGIEPETDAAGEETPVDQETTQDAAMTPEEEIAAEPGMALPEVPTREDVRYDELAVGTPTETMPEQDELAIQEEALQSTADALQNALADIGEKPEYPAEPVDELTNVPEYEEETTPVRSVSATNRLFGGVQLTGQFDVDTYLKEKSLYDQAVAWLSARCMRLGDIDLAQYPSYGFIVDLINVMLKDIDNLLGNQALEEIIELQVAGGKAELERVKEALQAELMALPEEAQTPVEEILNPQEARDILGKMDTTNAKEYLGPAPDGFEMIEDPFETAVSEEKIIQAYQETEKSTAEKMPDLNVEPNKSQPSKKE